jgi:hypothetical protein
MTLEQQQALARARARLRVQQQEVEPQPSYEGFFEKRGLFLLFWPCLSLTLRSHYKEWVVSGMAEAY